MEHCWHYLCVLGGWKPTVESSAFSYTEPQRGRGLYSSPKFSTAASNSLGFNGNSSLGAVSSNTYWSNTNRVENVMDTSCHGANREPVEKKQNTRNGCRLFGIQLLGNSNVEEASPVSTPKMVGEDRPVPPVDTEFDQHSEPSNIHRSDIPSVSCDADKSCLISPLESQSKQIRSCTKVVSIYQFFITLPHLLLLLWVQFWMKGFNSMDYIYLYIFSGSHARNCCWKGRRSNTV